MEESGNDSQDGGKKDEKNRVDTDDNNQPSTSTATHHELEDHSYCERIDDASTCNAGWRLPPRAPPEFFAVNEITHRQIGLGNNFQENFNGSVHTIKRLQLLRTFLLSPKELEFSLLLNFHHGESRCAVDFNKTGELIVSSSQNLAICIWNWAAGTECHLYDSGHTKTVYEASWLPHDNELLITCGEDGQVRILDTVAGWSRHLALHHGACNQFTLHPETPDVVISTGDDGTVLSTDIRTNVSTNLVSISQENFVYQMHTIDSNPRNSYEFCVAGDPATILIFDRRNTRGSLFELVPAELRYSMVGVSRVTYNYDGTEILASCDCEDIYLFDNLMPGPPRRFAHSYRRHDDDHENIKGVNYFGPKSEFIMTGSDYGKILVWEKNSGDIVHCLRADAPGVVNFIKPHPWFPVLASSGLNYDVKIWIPGVNKEEQIPSGNTSEEEDDISGNEERHQIYERVRPAGSRVTDETEYRSLSPSRYEPDFLEASRPHRQKPFRRVFLRNVRNYSRNPSRTYRW